MFAALAQSAGPIIGSYLDNFRLLVEVGRSHGGERDSLQLPEAFQIKENTAQFAEQFELVRQRDLKTKEANEEEKCANFFF